MKMQINGYSSIGVLSNGLYGGKNAASLKTKNSSQALQGLQANRTNKAVTSDKTDALSKAEEMSAFKTEIHQEISQIVSKRSFKTISDSIQVTDKAMEKMKNDPKFRAKIMDYLRRNTAASHHPFPFETRSTMTITEEGCYGYSACIFPHDSAASKSANKKKADDFAVGAFYHYERKDKGIDMDKIWLQPKEKKATMEKILLEKSDAQKRHQKRIYDRHMQNDFVNAGHHKRWDI